EAVARAKGLQLPKDIVNQTIIKLEKSPKEATSSMHRDLLADRNTEVTSLTQFVVNEGLKYGVATPLYEKIANALL
ncbi:MAG TPA: ketopantoate reductase C-terminal domain-containing protein, partial [Flavobacterium sp.]|nr:ketopantoate reductase C-terminal domain-containing protein [Flavobacterium sp.]